MKSIIDDPAQSDDKFAKFCLSDNGINKIFTYISSKDYKQGEKIILTSPISLQIANETYLAEFDLYKLILCDTKYYYEYFLININDLMRLHNYSKKSRNNKHNSEDIIINIKELSANYNNDNHMFFIKIHIFDIRSLHVYQIYLHTEKFDHPSLNFIYSKNIPIDLRKYNTIKQLSQLSTLNKLCVRVISKTTIVSFTLNHDNTHSGNLFYFDIIDSEQATLRVAVHGFLAQRYYKIIHIGKLYELKGYFSLIEITNYKETNNNMHLYKGIAKPKYEIVLGNDVIITELPEDNCVKTLKQLQKELHFRNIKDILTSSVSKIEFINTFGYVKKVEFLYRKVYALRPIILVDHTGYEIRVLLWNQFTFLPIFQGDYVRITNIQCKTGNGKESNINHLTTVDETEIEINPIEKDFTFSNIQIRNLYQGFLFKDSISLKPKNNIKHNNKHDNNNKQYEKFIGELLSCGNNYSNCTYLICCYIKDIEFEEKEHCVYMGCPNKKCKQKLNKNNNIGWTCVDCRSHVILPCYYFRNFIITISDCSGEMKLQITNDLIKTLLEISADTIYSLCNKSNYSKDDNNNTILSNIDNIVIDLINDIKYNKQFIMSITRPQKEIKDNLYCVTHINLITNTKERCLLLNSKLKLLLNKYYNE